MAGFPTGPTNGQQVTANGITYTYNSTKTAWVRNTTAGTNLTAASLAVTNSTASTSSASGALIVTGGVGIGGNLYVAGAINIATLGVTTLTVSTTSALAAATAASLSTATIVASGTTQVQSLGIGTAASGITGEIRATNAITAFYSDKRLKTNFKAIEHPLDKVDQLTGLMYTQNALAEQFGYNDYSQQVGVLAQDVQQVQPEAVKPAPFDIAEDGTSSSGENYLTVQYEKLIPLLIEAIKELRAEVNQLKGL